MALVRICVREFDIEFKVWTDYGPDGEQRDREPYDISSRQAVQRLLQFLEHSGADLVTVVSSQEYVWVYYKG